MAKCVFLLTEERGAGYWDCAGSNAVARGKGNKARQIAWAPGGALVVFLCGPSRACALAPARSEGSWSPISSKWSEKQ